MQITRCAAVLFACIAGAGRAEIRIDTLNADIVLAKDGSADIVEELVFVTGGGRLRDGLFREIPLTPQQQITEVHVRRDGVDIGHEIRRGSGGLRVQLIEPGAEFTPGEYRIDLRYRVLRAVGYESGRAVFRWDITGTAWTVPIGRVEARVAFPDIEPADLQFTAYTGRSDTNGRDFLAEWRSSDTLQFRGIRTVMPGESLRVHLRFPEAVFALPWQSRGYVALSQVRSSIPGFLPRREGGPAGVWTRDDSIMGAAVFVVLAYFATAWAIAGRDPAREPRPPSPVPPEGISPAVMRYLMQMRYDAATFAAALLSMAVQGHIQIVRRGDEYEIEGGTASSRSLADDEYAVSQALDMRARGRLRTQAAFATPLARASQTLETYLESTYRDAYFSRNTGIWAAGVGLSVSVLLFGSCMLTGFPTGLGLAALAIPFLFACMYGLHAARHMWAEWRVLIHIHAMPASRLRAAMAAATGTLLLGVLATGLGFVQFALGWPGLVVWAAVLALINLAFGYLLPARSRLGRSALDRIESFRTFLDTKSESFREHFADEADRARAFSGFMPYAVALGVEDRWLSHFIAAMRKAGIDQERGRGARIHDRVLAFLLDPVGQRFEDALFLRSWTRGARDSRFVGRGMFSRASRIKAHPAGDDGKSEV